MLPPSPLPASRRLFLALQAFAFGCAAAAVGCGGCPSSRYTSSSSARDETTSYKLQRSDDGARVVGVFDARTGYPSSCDASCLALANDTTSSCTDVCHAIDPYEHVASCSFGAGRSSVTCDIHVPAQEASCSCDIYDC